jgi:hypothetical protein
MKYLLLLLNILTITVSLLYQNEIIKPNNDENPMLYFPYNKVNLYRFYKVDFDQILDKVLSSGIYYAVLQVNDQIKITKLINLK